MELIEKLREQAQSAVNGIGLHASGHENGKAQLARGREALVSAQARLAELTVLIQADPVLGTGYPVSCELGRRTTQVDLEHGYIESAERSIQRSIDGYNQEHAIFESTIAAMLKVDPSCGPECDDLRRKAYLPRIMEDGGCLIPKHMAAAIMPKILSGETIRGPEIRLPVQSVTLNAKPLVAHGITDPGSFEAPPRGLMGTIYCTPELLADGEAILDSDPELREFMESITPGHKAATVADEQMTAPAADADTGDCTCPDLFVGNRDCPACRRKRGAE